MKRKIRRRLGVTESRIIHRQPKVGTNNIPSMMMRMEPTIQKICWAETESMLGDFR